MTYIKKDEEDGFCLKMVIDILTSQIIMIKIDVILLIISNLYFVRLVTSIANMSTTRWSARTSHTPPPPLHINVATSTIGRVVDHHPMVVDRHFVSTLVLLRLPHHPHWTKVA